jgi:hypothetical protein
LSPLPDCDGAAEPVVSGYQGDRFEADGDRSGAFCPPDHWQNQGCSRGLGDEAVSAAGIAAAALELQTADDVIFLSDYGAPALVKPPRHLKKEIYYVCETDFSLQYR